MKLYHGSTVKIAQIDLKKSKPNKDFGKGFYLSVDERQAYDMATFKAAQLNGEPIVTTYEFDERLLLPGNSELRIKVFEDYDMEWANFIFANRSNKSNKPVHDYDIVIGPIANDRVGLQIRRFMENEIDLQTFIQRLKFMRGLTIQYFFGTERAIQLLKYNG
ncbi:MAG: DUF3990 domain-containing protein [Mediterranea sp.]|jgi:hypothetical protein|nr:DUF3990 domain-containing protein [Mediterranea sp.]